MVISWLLNSISKEISASIIFSKSAYEIWYNLRDRFQQSNGPRVFQLRRELINHNQNQNSVSVYFTKLKALWEELSNFHPAGRCRKCTCGGVKELNDYFKMAYVVFSYEIEWVFCSSLGSIIVAWSYSTCKQSVLSYFSRRKTEDS